MITREQKHKFIIVLMSCLCAAGLFFMPGYAQALEQEAGYEDGSASEFIVAQDLDEYMQLTAPETDSVAFDVNVSSGRIITGKKGESAGSFEKVFGTDFDEVEGSRDAVAEAIESTEGYHVAAESKSRIRVLSDYRLGTILVSGAVEPDEAGNCFGADRAVVYDGESTLIYSDEEALKQGYDLLVEAYGEECVIMDRILMPESEVPEADADTDEAAVSPYKGWGTTSMYLDEEIRKNADNARPITVAVLDSGINSGHEIFRGTAISPDSMNIVEPGGSIEDDNGHGTMVSGVIAESTPPNVQLLVLKITRNATGTNVAYATLSGMIKALQAAQQQKADVINISYGDYCNKADCEKIDSALAEVTGKGSIVCTSSGNKGGNMVDSITGKRFYPADSPYAVSVGAIDQGGRHAVFSKTGENLDFVAPGANLTLASARDDSGYVTNQGTSFACPYVSASAAFLIMENTKNSPDTIYDQLAQISDDLGAKGKDLEFGNGMPNFANSAQLAPISLKGIPEVTLSQTTYAYDGKKKTPRVMVSYGGRILTSYKVSYPKNSPAIGHHKVMVTLTGNYAKNVRIKTGFDIVPQTVSMKNKKIRLSGKRTKATITWSKSQGKYQVMISRTSTFTGARTYTVKKNKITVSGLKPGKTYYVKVRAVKTVKGRKYRSAWSDPVWFRN